MKLILSAGLAFGAIAIAQAPAAAQDAEAPTTDVADEAERLDPDAVRCERRAVTGSRARRIRVCMTNAQWETLRRDGNRDATDTIDNGTRIGLRGG
ncbi:hypothetical protein [Parasphingopyxis marina]|uniref:Uncharacterized protein n=1 Tax=Parasphingopyxis marina TaxID=2761622 RepID=A0A842HYI1_9SPHN|nr:hypothetical protein [Parasphingopyxis marina]MBC2777399.1 hypothetical protein [Parasphingopyxis marina]